MNIKYHFIIILFSINVFTLPAQESNNPQQGGKIIIDGLFNDWQQEFRGIHKDNKISWAVTHDNENIYLCFQTIDGSLKQKILRSGMTLQLSTKGDKKIKASIIYPLKSDISERYKQQTRTVRPVNQTQRQPADRAAMRQEQRQPADRAAMRQEQRQPADRAAMRQEQLKHLINMQTKGFNKINGIYPHTHNEIKVALSMASEFLLCYEARIPFSELFGENYSPDDISSPLRLKLTITGISPPAGGQAGAMRSSGGRGGGSRGGGGGRSGGGGGMRPGGRPGGANTSDLSNTSVYKAEIQLNNTK